MLDKTQILSVLAPHNDRILTVHKDALQHFCDKYSEDRVVFCKRTMANMLRDLLVFYAKREFADLEVDGIRTYEKSNSFYIEFDGKAKNVDALITARFKKVNKSLIASNIPTTAATDFNSQQQPNLVGVNWDGYIPTNVNFAHLPDDLRTTYQGVYVTQPNGNKAIEWYTTLLSQDEANKVVTLPVQTQIETKARRVKGKASSTVTDKKKSVK